MLKDYEIVIADTSCFILLNKIGELELLQKLFGTVITTDIIASEFGDELPSWVIIKSAENRVLQNSLDVDPGEASTITLSLETPSSLLIIDDNKGRKLARKFDLKITGTLGVLLKAKQNVVIPFLAPVLEKVQHTNFRFSSEVLTQILLMAEE
ncbi:MAG TPA: DUF3368 domain-containing protein [Dyadobacter sp.]|jgi:predicted nucleic acid-binding protein|nr:DUF3368 domain-containing protein [Dyadobacter sp.]